MRHIREMRDRIVARKTAIPVTPDALEVNQTADVAEAEAGAAATASQVGDDEEEMERRIRDFFEENFERLRLEGDRSLAPEVKEAAWQQVLLYWRRLKEIAVRVTDTEVRLNLPRQMTPQGRVYGIEGVVDIVREHDQTTMYDVKTHDAHSIRGNLSEYERQLNVYAYIWQNLRGEALDEMAIICTRFPNTIKDALETDDKQRLEQELPRWNPVIDIPFSKPHVEQTISEFGQVVDAIEGGEFAPSPVSKLRVVRPGERAPFAVTVCTNCDARFSCSSYRTYALGAGGVTERKMRDYFADVGGDDERDSWLSATLDAAPPAEAFDEMIAQGED